MLRNINNLKIEAIYKGNTKRYSVVSNRKSNAFVFRTSGHSNYRFDDCSFDVRTGEIIFLPKGSTYELSVIGDEECSYVAIKFSAEYDEASPFVLSSENFQDADEFENNLTEMWKFGDGSEHYRCYSIFYNLLAYMANAEKLSSADKKKYNLISPALSYLKKHIYDSDLRVDSLCRICGISLTYFRKIFLANYGVSPQKYILEKRLSHAKTVIDNCDFETISEVALSVGYTDPLYFSRAFRKAYGISPMQYARLGQLEN